MDKRLPAWLDALCDVFQDELDRQGDLLALCRAQGRAALEHDVELLEARTEGINLLLADAVEAEQRRLAFATQIVAALGLPLERQSLSGLIEAAPSPWKERMADLQGQMRALLAETRAVVRTNNHTMRRSAKIVGEALDALVRCVPGPQGEYDARGAASPGKQAGQPAVLDRRG